jgi:phospholipid/cholesterol/gamma-HCH transport system substrate-binding protein
MRSHVITVLIFGAIAIGVTLFLFRLSGSLTLGEQYKVRAIVPSAGNLAQGTSVTMAGARVGVVAKVERQGVGAIVEMRIEEESVRPLPSDTKAQLAVRTPLGENYIELVPGSSQQELPTGAVISPAKDDGYVDVDEILSVLQGETRDRAREVFRGLGKGVGNRGKELNGTLRSAGSILEAGSNVTDRLEDDRETIGKLVDQLGTVATAVGERGDSIRTVARQGLTTFRALADRDESVSELIDTLPPTLRQVRSTTATLRSTSDAATPVVANLSTALRQVRPAFRQLKAGAAVGRRIVTQLDAAAPRLQSTLASVQKASPALSAALPQLNKVFCQANPALRYIKPYIADFMAFVSGLGSASNSYDAIGHTIRLMPVLSENAVLGLPTNIRETAFELIRKGVFNGTEMGVGFTPFPEPGQAETGFKAGDKSLVGPKDVPGSGYKYPRIMRDC